MGDLSDSIALSRNVDDSVEASRAVGMTYLFRVGILLGARGWDSGSEPHYGIIESIMVFRSLVAGFNRYRA